MQQTICDICGACITERNKSELTLTRKGEAFPDICSYCDGKIFAVIDNIKNAPKDVCEECGRAS